MTFEGFIRGKDNNLEPIQVLGMVQMQAGKKSRDSVWRIDASPIDLSLNKKYRNFETFKNNNEVVFIVAN